MQDSTVADSSANPGEDKSVIALAVFPLAAYCLFLAFLHGRRRPTVFSGTVDLLFLAIGSSGLFLAGPGRLFLPLNVLTFWGAGAWILWTMFYIIVVLLVVQKLRRRIIVYNCSTVDMVSHLGEVVRNFDSSAASLGNSMMLPQQGIQFYIEVASRSRNVVLVATGSTQNVAAWRRLETAIDLSFRTISISRGSVAWFFLVAACLLIGVGFQSLVLDYFS